MTENGKKVLTIKWWEWWKDHPVSGAVYFGVMHPWHRKVTAELKRRRKKSEIPFTQAQLCEAACLNRSGLFVMRTCREGSTEQENNEARTRTITNPVLDLRQLFAIAAILKLPTESLVPEITEVVTLATKELCNGDSWQRPTIGYR